MKFGFIAHPTSVALKRHVKLVDLLDRTLRERERMQQPSPPLLRALVPFAEFGRITSRSGAHCEGLLQYLPATAQDMLARPRDLWQHVVDAVESLADTGAGLVGLGGFTGIVGARGEQTLQKVRIPVTTGNSLTAYATWRNMMDVLTALELEPAREEIAVVGYPGSIALVTAKLLARAGCRLVLVHRPTGDIPSRQLDHLPAELQGQVRLMDHLGDCYAKVRLYVAASSSGALIDSAKLLPGSVVVDAALPRDVVPSIERRSDIAVIDGGLVSACDEVRFGSELLGLAPRKLMNGCLAETIVLALEGRAEPFSIGRELSEHKVLEIGRLAGHHGFAPQHLSWNGEILPAHQLRGLARFHAVARTRTVESPTREDVLRLYGEHINPPLRDLLQAHRIDRVFTRGTGCRLTDASGIEFLDFVAGYGCLNVGHNHPHIVSTVRRFLDESCPSFVQYVSMPTHTTRLAHRLCELAPTGLTRVFFSNSGTEAVEAAIKLVRAASGLPRLLHCDNAYHGKTLGALSVTGRDRHRMPFAPLLQGCTSIPFGDANALEEELSRGDVAAFIVEPIQGEGGVVLPPPGYLSAVQSLCKAYGCLLVVDEVQTGLGRTGRWFACEWEGVEPDVLVLAKSLSGGLVPIGATLCKPVLWDRAYGSRDRCTLHTSTFGGGNLAAAAALATLDVIDRERLADNALHVGTALLTALKEAAAPYSFVKEVRGQGLMLAIEFSCSFQGSLASFVREFGARVRGDSLGMMRMLSDRAHRLLEETAAELENNFEEMFVLRFVSKMSDRGILTFATANNSKVVRIQPPLVLSMQDAQRFVAAFSSVCQEMGTVLE